MTHRSWYAVKQTSLLGFLSGVMVEVLDCVIVESEFDLQSCYVHFRTNTLGKGMNLLILLATG